MEDFKLNIFKSENNNKSFPEYKKLSTLECNFFKQKIIECLGLEDSMSDNINILKLIEEKSIRIPNENAETDNFNFVTLISKLEISKTEYVNINWYRFEDMDRFQLTDFSNYLKYIWYAGPDEIEIFPDDLSWILSIDAMGGIYLYTASTKMQ